MKIVIYIHQIDRGSSEEQPKLNAENRALIEQTVTLAENCGGEVSVVAAGGEKERTLLREALARGCSSASLILINGDSDIFLAKGVAEVIQKMDYDIVVTGYRTLDGGTSYIGPQLAGYLNLPQISFVQDAKIKDGKIYAKRKLGSSVQQVESSLPCLLTLANSVTEFRTMSVMNLIKACEKEIETLVLNAECGKTKEYYEEITAQSVSFEKKECEMYYTIEVENEPGQPVQSTISVKRAAHIIFDQMRERGLIS